MALITISDTITPEIYNEYMEENWYAKSALWKSGIIGEDPRMNELLNGGATTFNFPFWKMNDMQDQDATPVNEGGIGQVKYTLAADINHDICKAYDVEHPEAGVAFRATFLIDKDKHVRAQHVNDLPLGREIPELLRLVDALQFTEEHGEVCPAGWRKGDAGMKASPDGVKEYLSSHKDDL